MSKNKAFFDQIELYLTNQLKEGERLEFESQLGNDPLLKEEFNLQQDIINSVQNFRKIQLKARLDSIPVSSGYMISNTASTMKIAGSVLISAAIGVGAYLYLQDLPEELSQTPTPVQEQTQEIILDDTGKETIAEIAETAPATALDPRSVPALSETKSQGLPSGSELQKPQTMGEMAEARERVQPNVIEEFEDDVESNEATMDLPVVEPTQESSELAPLEIENRNDGKHKFHYQYYNGKLYLYGNFHNIPYEILELNQAEGQKLYLFYSGDFFSIDNGTVKVSPLKIIKDDQLISDLKIILNQKGE